jgi:hypothetical protein
LARERSGSAGTRIAFLLSKQRRPRRRRRDQDVFKVTTERDQQSDVILKLEGRLATAWVAELERAIGAAMTGDARVTLDLDGVSFADADGVALVRRAVDRGARLRGGSKFIGALIGQERPR